MKNELQIIHICDTVSSIIEQRKIKAKVAINSEILAMNWSIGHFRFTSVLEGNKAEFDCLLFIRLRTM